MPNKANKKTNYIFLFLRLGFVTAGIIFAIFWFRGIDEATGTSKWSNLVGIFKQMKPALFTLALGIFFIGQIIVAFRWWLLLRTQSIHITIWAAVRLHFLGLFYNNVMPSSVGGDLIRAWYVTRHTDKKFEAALSVFVDRIIGLASTIVIATFFYLLFLRGKGSVITDTEQTQPGLLSRIADYRAFFFYAAIVVVATVVMLSIHPSSRAVLNGLWIFVKTIVLKMMRKFKDAAIIYCSRPITIICVFSLTVAMQLTTITGFWILGRNLGIDASIKYYYVFFTITWVLGAIPISIGGAVVVEVLLAGLFIRFAGVEQTAASALALSQRAVWMITSLPGAGIHLIGAHLPKDLKAEEYPPPNSSDNPDSQTREDNK